MKRIILLLSFFFSLILTAQQTKIDSLNAKLKLTSNEDSIIDLNEKIIGSYMSSNRIDEANSYLKKLTYKSKNNKNLLALSYKLKGNLYAYSEKIDSALVMYSKGLKILKDTNPTKIAADLYLNIGLSLIYKNKKDSVPYCFDKASGIYYKLKDYRGLCFLHYNSASYYFNIDKNFECENNLTKLIEYNKIYKNDFFDAKAYYLLGVLNTQISNNEAGIEYLLKSVALFEKSNNYLETAQTLMALAIAYGDNLVEAENIFQKANFLYQKELLPKNNIYYIFLLDFTEVLIKRKKFEEAQKQLDLVKRFAAQYNFEFIANPLLITFQAEILIHNNRIIEASLILDKIDTTNLPPDYKIAYYKVQTDLNIKNKNFKKAMAYKDAYIYIKDSFQNNLLKNKLIYTNTKFETEKKETENLKLKTEKAEQAIILEKEKNQKWLFGFSLVTALIVILIGGYIYQKNKKQKIVIENLQKELHHRIKNNLAIINTFIEVAKEEFSDVTFNTKLSELQNRIASINEVHQQLYKNTDITSLSVKKYVQKLTDNIQQSFANNNIVVTQNINDSLKLNAEQSFAVGLIINEFLTNSFKYAFDENKGIILIEMSEKNQNLLLSLSDNGKGLPKYFNLEQTESFGLRIIKLLTKQLNGSFKLEGTNGVQLTIQFPK